MAVPTKEDMTPDTVSDTEAELSSIQFSAQFSGSEVQTGEAAVPDNTAAAVQETADDILEQAEREQEEMSRRDREILDALDQVLKQSGTHNAAPAGKKPRRKFDLLRLTVGTVKSGAGLLSLSLTLIFMGIVTMCVLLSGTSDHLLIAKLSPISAVFVGGELLLSWFASGKRLRIHIPSICITAAIVAAGCVLSAALNREDIEMREEQSGRVIAGQIYEQSYKELCRTADISELAVTADLAPGSAGKTWDTLSAGDIVTVTVRLDGTYSSPREFAQECRGIISAYKSMGIPVSDFSFSADTRLTSFRLNVNGLFQQDLDVDGLTEMTDHIYFEDYDYIEDLDDLSYETTEN